MFFSLPTETFTNDNKDFNGLYKFYTPDLKMKTIRMPFLFNSFFLYLQIQIQNLHILLSQYLR